MPSEMYTTLLISRQKMKLSLRPIATGTKCLWRASKGEEAVSQEGHFDECLATAGTLSFIYFLFVLSSLIFCASSIGKRTYQEKRSQHVLIDYR